MSKDAKTQPSPRLRMAAVQAPSVPGDLAANVARAVELVDRGAEQGARVVVLPELFLPGYHPPTLSTSQTADVAADDDSRVDDTRLDPLRLVAQRSGACVVVGAAVKDPAGARHLSSLLVGPDGSVVEAYRKQFLCGPDERGLFAPGAGGASLEVDGWVLALSICYDGCFPEHARAAALDGAHAYLCSSAYLVGGEHRRDLYYRARAVENGMFVVLADAVGGPDPWRFGGGSCVIDPEGRPIATAASGVDDVVVVDLELELLVRTRAAHSMLADLPATAATTVSRRLLVG